MPVTLLAGRDEAGLFARSDEMKKTIFLIFILCIMLTGCSSNGTQNAGDFTEAHEKSQGNTVSPDKQSASKTLDGQIKFYPTIDPNYKTAGNEMFDFWFDIPNEWKAVDKSKDGSAYTILPDSGTAEMKIYGRMIQGQEKDFYKELAGTDGKISDFAYRDGWKGKRIDIGSSETYYVRVDGDSYLIFYIKADSEWMKQNADKIEYVAMSARTTKESYGDGLGDSGKITLDDLQLGKIKINMSYEELMAAIQQKPVKEEKEEYQGLDAKTLFFKDDTQVYIVDGTVYSINITSPGYSTPRGLSVGDGTAKLKKLYGAPDSINEETQWNYTYKGYEVFTAVIDNGKITQIEVDLPM